MYKLKLLRFCIGILLLPFIAVAQSKPAFPVQLSANKRYLVDKNGNPFLIKEFSAWALIQSLSEEDESAFLDSIKAKGFNTVLTSVISNAKAMAGNPPYWQGISPFNKEWDFSTPNEKYFQHVDRFFKMAESKGFFVMAVPCYLGYIGDGPQGWWDELNNPNNDTLKMRTYGEYLAKRYVNTPNIMWVAGGDNNAEGPLQPFEINLIAGIKTFDKTHLWTGHFDSNKNVRWSSEHPVFGGMVDIDGLYAWTETLLAGDGPHYKTELAQYKKGKMTMQLDISYEHDNPHFADNENYQWIRRKMYDGFLSGCKGASFSAGTLTNQCFTFKNWQPLMNTEGMQQVSYCFKLFNSLPSHLLVPDETNDIILSGRGEFGSRDYVCAARASDSSCYVMYIPKGQTIFMNVKKISGDYMRIYWYNPRTGMAIKIGTAEPREYFGIVPPSEDDWVMVFDNKNFAMPPSIN